MILTDAGPLYSLVCARDAKHTEAKATLAKVSLPMVTTWPCLTEAMYLAHSSGGWLLQNALWRLYNNKHVTILELETGSGDRIQTLMRTYADIPMDFADASVVAAAEAIGISRVFTFDSHFFAYRLASGAHFSIIGISSR